MADGRKRRKKDEDSVQSQRYYTTLKSIGDGVVATDAEGNVEFLNPVAEALTGWPSDDARGRPIAEVFQIVNEYTRAVVESPVDKVIREGQIVGLANHTILIARDGTEYCIDDSGAPIFGMDGELAGVVLVFRDVTEKRREEARRTFTGEASLLLSSSLDYQETLKRVSDLAIKELADWCAVDIVSSDGDLERLATSHIDPEKLRFAVELSEKYPPDPNSPYGVHEVVRSGEAQLLSVIPEELLVAAAQDEEHLRLIMELDLRSSIVVPLQCRGRTLGAITLVSTQKGRHYDEVDLALAKDLARVAALAVDNARLYRDAERANRLKDEFLTTVSHELRTPLHAILGWATLLRTAELSEEKREHGLATIERNARAQAQLIEDLLDISRIISGNLRLEMRSLDLGDVIDAAIEAVALAADVKGVRIRSVIDGEARRATGDAARLQQVVWNLLSNAVKFTDRGGTIDVRLQRLDSKAEIQVTDSGEGIPRQFLPHLFERFQQADSSSVRQKGGLGLGLAIVKHLAELHGGSVSAESPGPGEGATFRVTLPLSAVVRRDVAETPTPSSLELPSLDGLRILVVDDEVDARVLVAEALSGYGATVVVAGSADEALAEIARERPDILVSDIGMPVRDGYSLIRAVRTAHAARDLPAIALTAYARSEDRTRALLAGFQAHVAKPVEIAELVIVVATQAGRTSVDLGV